MTQKVIGIIKIINEAKNFIGMGDGKGKWMFLNIDKIEDSYPPGYTQWQKTIFLVDDKQKIDWGDEDPKYFKEAAYNKYTKPIPEPIPDKFTKEYIPAISGNGNASINLDITPLVTILTEIRDAIKELKNNTTSNAMTESQIKEEYGIPPDDYDDREPPLIGFD